MVDDSGFRPPDEDDEARPTGRARRPDDTAAMEVTGPAADDDGPLLRFDDVGDDAGQPHWTDPPTGELPRLFADQGGDPTEPWNAFAGTGPVWRDQASPWDNEDPGADLRQLRDDDTRVGALVEDEGPAWPDEDQEDVARAWAAATGTASAADDEPSSPAAAEAAPAGRRSRVTSIRSGATTGASTGSVPGGEARRGGARPTNPRPYSGAPSGGGTAGRNMPVAAAVGVGMAALALLLLNLGPGYAMILVTGVLVGAAAELYAALRKVGYQPATLLGLVGVAGLALASFWRGESAYPLVLFLAVSFALLWFLFADTEARPVPNLAVTLLGLGYVGVLGSFAALILKFPNGTGMLICIVLGTVAYDIGGLFVGSSAGRSRLAPSVSPNKTYEGLAGGMLCALLVSVVAGVNIAPFTEFMDALALGLVVAVFAPLGDLAESMVKRDLDVKDMSSVLPGHGGLLDRFDALLFTLPAGYFLVRLLDLV